jgi:hypothetical protein
MDLHTGTLMGVVFCLASRTWIILKKMNTLLLEENNTFIPKVKYDVSVYE